MARKEGYRWRRRGWQANDRQREVLDLLAEGKSNAEIAVRLGITLDGAKWHVGELLAETGCGDRQALASWWRKTRTGERKAGFLGLPLFRIALAGAGIAVASVLVVALAVALSGGEPGPAAPEAVLGASPTPWPEEALEALAASQGRAPDSCEPPRMRDLRLVDGAELLAEGLAPAGRVIIDGHCPLYVANRVDRAVVWVGGGGLLHIDRRGDQRLTNADPCCAGAVISSGGVSYRLSASGWDGERDGRWKTFSGLSASLARIEMTDSDGAYLTLTLRETTPTPGRLRHRVAIASDGQVFIDPAPVPGGLVVNGLTGEAIDVGNFGTGMPLNVEVGTGAVRTDCWEEDGVCRVYLDGVRGAREGNVGVFNPSTLLAPFDGVLNCVRVDGEFWSIDGPARAYELSNGNLTLRFGAFGGAWEEWEDCEPRDVRRGQAFPVWTYTYVEASVGGEPRSIVSTRDGRLHVGDVQLTLGCPCEPRK
jgi:DNA-binding CsgD family transcriptional regulator